jgi:DNA-binding response OmpR family regulator
VISILLIERRRRMRDTLLPLAQEHKLQVFHCRSAAEAFQVARDPRVVFVDLRAELPRDGLGKLVLRFPCAPTIAVGDGNEREIADAMKAGAGVYLLRDELRARMSPALQDEHPERGRRDTFELHDFSCLMRFCKDWVPYGLQGHSRDSASKSSAAVAIVGWIGKANTTSSSDWNTWHASTEP